MYLVPFSPITTLSLLIARASNMSYLHLQVVFKPAKCKHNISPINSTATYCFNIALLNAFVANTNTFVVCSFGLLSYRELRTVASFPLRFLSFYDDMMCMVVGWLGGGCNGWVVCLEMLSFVGLICYSQTYHCCVPL